MKEEMYCPGNVTTQHMSEKISGKMTYGCTIGHDETEHRSQAISGKPYEV